MPAMRTDQKGEQSWTCKIGSGAPRPGPGALWHFLKWICIYNPVICNIRILEL